MKHIVYNDIGLGAMEEPANIVAQVERILNELQDKTITPSEEDLI